MSKEIYILYRFYYILDLNPLYEFTGIVLKRLIIDFKGQLNYSDLKLNNV